MIEDRKSLFKILETLSALYVLVMLIVFPLVVDETGFFNILECKWYFYLIAGGMYTISSLVVILYFMIIKRINLLKRIKLGMGNI